MKRLILILLSLLLLTGCTGNTPETNVPETTVPETTIVPTEPPIPWIEQQGTPWDDNGTLVELSLSVPGGLHYANSLGFDGDLLLWSIDDHKENIRTLELCLIELDTGEVAAQRDIEFSVFTNPQVLGNRIYLCDNVSGTILELDHTLETVNSWHIEPIEGVLYMGAEEKLYFYEWDGSLQVLDLKTGEKSWLLGEDAYIDYFTPQGDSAAFDYYDSVTGEKRPAVLDLLTGEILTPALDKSFSYVSRQNGTWLCEVYRDNPVYYVGDDSGVFLRSELGYDSLRILDENTLLRTMDDGCHIGLYDLSGKSIAQVMLTGNPYSQNCTAIIPSEAFGGYFLMVGDYNSSQRLLYWDTANSAPGEDILWETIPKPEEAEALIRQQVDQIEQTYGLNVLVGEDCGTSFYDFNAEQITDWDMVAHALDTLTDALADYPDGFFRQLRYDTIRSVEIHLAGTLTATNEEYTDTYEAFVQEEYDKQVMVVDIFQADQDTYYHEFSHIIDAFLLWDSQNREGALFSEDAWNALNPAWFPGYTYDYSWHQDVEDYSCFVDSYSTIRPTEDRARVLEYAMSEYGSWTFEDAPVLQSKLRFYCQCIRDAFDTTGWPETLLWEQYLP